jgi:hypothetical protein
VAHLEGVADELLRRRRGDAEDSAELGDAELRDERGALPRDGFLVLAPRDGEGGGVVDRLGRVQVSLSGGEEQLVGRGPVLGGLAGSDR